MTDLRTRIAAAIEYVRIQRDGDAALMADAVIRELRLVQQSEVYKYGPLMPDGFQKAKLRHRYVTDWTTDD